MQRTIILCWTISLNYYNRSANVVYENELRHLKELKVFCCLGPFWGQLSSKELTFFIIEIMSEDLNKNNRNRKSSK